MYNKILYIGSFVVIWHGVLNVNVGCHIFQKPYLLIATSRRFWFRSLEIENLLLTTNTFI